ncbi:hypothetical protein BHE74_00027999, partial [Ensete ventricosum]
FEIITTIHLYRFDPWELPKTACVRYLLVLLRAERSRTTERVLWKATGCDRPVAVSSPRWSDQESFQMTCTDVMDVLLCDHTGGGGGGRDGRGGCSGGFVDSKAESPRAGGSKAQQRVGVVAGSVLDSSEEPMDDGSLVALLPQLTQLLSFDGVD